MKFKREKLLVTVSGGRTSAYKAIMFKKHYENAYDMTFMFANTGAEHEETLIFVNRVDVEFGLNLIWVEAKVYHGVEKSSGYKVVDFNTASRNGEPFEEVVKKYGLPNQDFLHCTRELKTNPISAYMREYQIKRRTLGIRIDEPKRLKKLQPLVLYPLVDLFPMTKEMIAYFWKKQKFDLKISEELGNCVHCHKKSNKKLWTIAKNMPSAFDIPKRLEDRYSYIKSESQNIPRKMYRGQCTTVDIFNAIEKPFEEFVEGEPQKNLFSYSDNDECAEECGTVIA